MPQTPEYFHVQLQGGQIAINGSFARPVVNNGFVFEVCYKPISFAGTTFNQYWFDRNKVFPKSGCDFSIYTELLRYGLARGEQLPGGLVDETVDHLGMAALMPHIRSIGAKRVISDASLDPAQKKGCLANLESMLQQSRLNTVAPDQFMRTACELIGPREEFLKGLDASLKDKMGAELIERIRDDIYVHRDLGVRSASAEWNRWKRQFNRPARHRAEIDAMDALSVEARAGLIQVYSGFWDDILFMFRQLYRPPFLRFHSLWHLEKRWNEVDTTRHLFQGHCFGLHPAASLLIQTPTGRGLIEPLVLTDGTDLDFDRFLNGMMCALHIYADARDEGKFRARHQDEERRARDVADVDSRQGRRRPRH